VTMALWLAMYKQYMGTSQRGLELWPAATDEQKKQTKALVNEVNAAIPWSVTDVIKYVGQGDKTLTDQFMDLMKPEYFKPSEATASKTEEPQTNAKGWKLHTDKNGNKAYVGPNNEVEEVK
jgi:hypothetical protein